MLLRFFPSASDFTRECLCVPQYLSPFMQHVVQKNSSPFVFTDRPLTSHSLFYLPRCSSGFSAEYLWVFLTSMSYALRQCHTPVAATPPFVHSRTLSVFPASVLITSDNLWPFGRNIIMQGKCFKGLIQGSYSPIPDSTHQWIHHCTDIICVYFLSAFLTQAHIKLVRETSVSPHCLWFSHRLTGSDLPENFLLCYFQNISLKSNLLCILASISSWFAYYY